MTRKEHLEWCKERAYKYLDNGNITDAWSSFCSDMSKHDETKHHPALGAGIMQLAFGYLSSESAMRKYIEGVN